MKRRNGLRRTRFKQRKPNGTRAKSAGLRDAYLWQNHLCEWRCGEQAVEVDHIVQCSSSSYETTENYFATCRDCHERKHRENLRDEQIRIKHGKGEWFADAAEEFNYFGRCFYYDAREIL